MKVSAHTMASPQRQSNSTHEDILEIWALFSELLESTSEIIKSNKGSGESWQPWIVGWGKYVKEPELVNEETKDEL